MNPNPTLRRRVFSQLLCAAPMWRGVAIASAPALLGACGGGGDDGPALGPQQARFEGRLTTASGAPVAGAEVFLPSLRGTYTATTDGEGRYGLVVDVGDFPRGGSVVLRAFRAGFRPSSFSYTAPLEGRMRYTLTGGTAALVALQPDEHASRQFSEIVHLGDDSFGGSANSQLQTATRGLIHVSPVLDWNAADNGRLRRAAVRMQMRGLQGRSALTGRAGWVRLVDAAGNPVSSFVWLDFDTDASGGYSTIEPMLTLNAQIASGRLGVAVATGQNSSTDYDDIEYTGISVRLLPA